MSWFFESDIAKEHKKECKKDPNECYKCVWIDESHSAMFEVSDEIESGDDVEKEPDLIFDTSINRWTQGGKLHD